MAKAIYVIEGKSQNSIEYASKFDAKNAMEAEMISYGQANLKSKIYTLDSKYKTCSGVEEINASTATTIEKI